LRVGRVDAFPILVDERLLAVERCMDAEHPVVQEKGFVLIPLDKRGGFFCHAVFNVLIGDSRVVIKIVELPRGDITSSRAGAGPVRNVDIEAVLQRGVRFWTKVPFSEVAGRVAVVFERFSQRVVFRVESRNRVDCRRWLKR
jgi:hypothetical protein